MNRLHTCSRTGKKKRYVHKLDDNLFVVAQQQGVKHSTLSKESPLTAVVPKPSEQRSSATMRKKAKEVLISQTCNKAYKGKKGSTDLSDLSLNRWLDDMAMQQGVNRVSCQVTVIVVVIDIDVSSTLQYVFGVCHITESIWLITSASHTRVTLKS